MSGKSNLSPEVTAAAEALSEAIKREGDAPHIFLISDGNQGVSAIGSATTIEYVTDLLTAAVQTALDLGAPPAAVQAAGLAVLVRHVHAQTQERGSASGVEA